MVLFFGHYNVLLLSKVNVLTHFNLFMDEWNEHVSDANKDLGLISVVSRLVYSSIGHYPKAYTLSLNFILNFEAVVLNESLGA